MAIDQFVIGVDFGTDSVRALVVNAITGEHSGSSVVAYPRWKQNMYCIPSRHQYRQHPLDYLEGLERSIKEAINGSKGLQAEQIKGISIDTTGSSPVAVDKQGVPLALLPGLEENPNAMFVLWKDHTSTLEASEINKLAQKFPVNYLQFVGGIYSSEWFWAKLLHVLREDPVIRDHCYSWVEHCDWIPYVLTGGTDIHQMKRSVCSAGHKALWADSFGGLPPEDFFYSLDPLLKGFRQRLFTSTYTADQSAGKLSAEWAKRLGLTTETIIGIGAFDAHMGAVGGQIEPYYLSKVMGTSTCDMLVAPKSEMAGRFVHGICGQVDGSIIPGMIGLEAGQSAFGDSYAWFRDMLVQPVNNLLSQSGAINSDQAAALKEEISQKMIEELTYQASLLPVTEESELALDWLNGRRTPDADQVVKASMINLSLASSAAHLFKAWVEATCFGAKAIVDRFNSEGVQVQGLIGLGGVARKSPYILQVMADVMDMPIRIHRSEQTCALGAAMFAATACGIYPKVEMAMEAMGQGFEKTFYPDKKISSVYFSRYQQYRRLGEFTQVRSHS